MSRLGPLQVIARTDARVLATRDVPDATAAARRVATLCAELPQNYGECAGLRVEVQSGAVVVYARAWDPAARAWVSVEEGASWLPTIREALAVHEALRKLGFAAEAIFLQPAPLVGGPVHVVLREGEGAGAREFRYDCGAQELPEKEYAAQWVQAATWWNTLPDSEGAALFRASAVYRQRAALIEVLLKKGFSLGKGVH